jgi:hypothetical protein
MMISTKTCINASMSIALGLMLLAVAATSMAGERNTVHIETCKSEVRTQYGVDTDVAVVSERRIPSGTQVRLAARMDQDTTRFVNCWVPSNTNDDGSYSRGLDTLAARLQPDTTVVSY